jgi:hypothetical protein
VPFGKVMNDARQKNAIFPETRDHEYWLMFVDGAI